jgi:hypothetical protein
MGDVRGANPAGWPRTRQSLRVDDGAWAGRAVRKPAVFIVAPVGSDVWHAARNCEEREEARVIARHRPKSVFKPADVERVRERFQTILKHASEKPLVEVKPPVAAPARKAPVPPPAARARKRA